MTTKVWIYKPARTAMQSGLARTRNWVLEFEPTAPRRPDPLMGWASSAETQTQVRLGFETREEALAYAERKGLTVALEDPNQRRLVPKSYADNFRPDRVRD